MITIKLQKKNLIIWFAFIAFNITGCATHSVWEKRAYNKKTVNYEVKAKGVGFYSECSDVKKYFTRKIIIPFQSETGDGEFPPIEKGYIVISSDDQADYIIKRINKDQTSSRNRNSSILIKANYWETIDPDKKIQYWSGYEYFLGDKDKMNMKFVTQGPRPGFIYADEINMSFIERNEFNDRDCISLTKRPVDIEIIFTQGSLKYSQYKRNTSTRIALTPFAVALDVITSPLQLFAIVTVPLWAPR